MSLHLPPLGRIWSISGRHVLAANFYSERHLGALLAAHNQRHPKVNVVRYGANVKRNP